MIHMLILINFFFFHFVPNKMIVKRLPIRSVNRKHFSGIGEREVWAILKTFRGKVFIFHLSLLYSCSLSRSSTDYYYYYHYFFFLLLGFLFYYSSARWESMLDDRSLSMSVSRTQFCRYREIHPMEHSLIPWNDYQISIIRYLRSLPFTHFLNLLSI